MSIKNENRESGILIMWLLLFQLLLPIER
jgi:hypothetical protein